jgi:hypothetical protein
VGRSIVARRGGGLLQVSQREEGVDLMGGAHLAAM